jgi:hypothetical protein
MIVGSGDGRERTLGMKFAKSDDDSSLGREGRYGGLSLGFGT